MKSVKNSKLVSAMPLIGVLLVAAAFWANHLSINTIACVFISGIGCTWVGLGVLGIFIKELGSEYLRKQEINQKDERNIQIREKSGYLAFAVTLLSLAILEFVFLLTDNDIACIFIIGAMIIHIGSFFIALFYYGKKL